MTEETDRSRYLQYLPAIFHQPPDEAKGEIDLGQFLLPFDNVLADFESVLAVIDHYIAAGLTPDEFMPWLASWVALELDEHWEELKQRRLIDEAAELHKQRGKVAGLKRYLQIYDVRATPDIWEGRWPGGMQIGVASQIGGLSPEPIPFTHIERAERRQPPVIYDYYIIDTVAWAGHPDVPEGQRLKVYYPAHRVQRVEVGGEGDERYVAIKLVDGPSRRYEQATIVRRDKVVNEEYTLSVRHEVESETQPAGREAELETLRYKGDTLLVEGVELPYRFTVDLRVPCLDWSYLLSFQVESIDGTGPEVLRQAFEAEGISLSADMIVHKEEKGSRWWTIDDGGQRFLLVRKGVELSAYEWVGGRDWEEARQPGNVGRVRAIIDEVKPAHTIYYLRLTPVESDVRIEPMQIGVRSSIDVDTTIGE
jgi:phage tail-like protein